MRQVASLEKAPLMPLQFRHHGRMLNSADTTVTEIKAPRRGPRPMRPQDLSILQVYNAHLNIRTVEVLVGKSKKTIQRDVNAKRFPPGLRLSSRCTRWLSNDIREYLAATSRGEEWTPKAQASEEATA